MHGIMPPSPLAKHIPSHGEGEIRTLTHRSPEERSRGRGYGRRRR